MNHSRSLISPTTNLVLERALRDKLQRRSQVTGSLGELEPLAIRLGLIQNTLKPRLHEPQLLVFAADHGLAVDGIAEPQQQATHDVVRRLLTGRLPLPVFARLQGLQLTVVDAGMAEPVGAPHERLLVRKIAHGTRNCRAGAAMTLEQTQAAIRAGMEIGDVLDGNAVACAGVGVGAAEAAALVLSRLHDAPVRDLLLRAPQMERELIAHLLLVAQGALQRHAEAHEPVEVLAAFGGFEIAMMVGLMLVAASKRHLVMVDGMAAMAALAVACRIAPAVIDYCVFCRSHLRPSLDAALRIFHASALLTLGLDGVDGTGAPLTWPLVRGAAALLTELAEGEESGASQPGLSRSLQPTLADELTPARLSSAT